MCLARDAADVGCTKDAQLLRAGRVARSNAVGKRHQCLLEIEGELLRHSSSDEDVVNDMHLRGLPTSKRRKAGSGKAASGVKF